MEKDKEKRAKVAYFVGTMSAIGMIISFAFGYSIGKDAAKANNIINSVKADALDELMKIEP